MRRLDPKECAVLVVDAQEKLSAAMPKEQIADLTRATTILLHAAKLLGASVLATEQYPKGLGPTLPEIAAGLAQVGVTPIEKVDFSACDSLEFERAFARTGARVAVVVGMEAHVCVFQTVRELCARDVAVVVAADGVASRRADHRTIGLDLCRSAGATVSTMESVVFDWLRRAGTDEFKALSKLIR
jgi:nicotinamidase-related amidase